MQIGSARGAASGILALGCMLALGGCGIAASAQQPAAAPSASSLAPSVAAPGDLRATLSGDLVVLHWSNPAGIAPSGYRVFVNQQAPVQVPASALSYQFKAGAGGTQYYLQVQSVRGDDTSLPAATQLAVPYPADTAPATASAAPSAAPDPAAAGLPAAPSASAVPVAPAENADAEACGEVDQQVQIVLAALRDWEHNLAVEGDMTAKLAPPGDAVAALASQFPAPTAARVVALADAIKEMRQAFFGHGDVLPDGKQDGPHDYDTLKARIATGVPGC